MIPIYSVYFYKMGFGAATVYPIGFYDNLEDAKNRLRKAIPNYREHINNTVIGHGRIGWINENTFGDLNTELSANQPHSAIYLF